MAKASDTRIMRLWLKGYPASSINRILGVDNAKYVIKLHWLVDDVWRYATKDELKGWVGTVKKEEGC